MRAPSPSLGEVIRRQRELHRLTLRQFAALAGISNPYLSQIERGHRAPSEGVLEAIARSLKTTRDELFEQAGLGAREDDGGRARLQAVLRNDGALTEHQRRLLLEVYDGLVATSAGAPPARPARADGAGPQTAGDA